MELKSFLDEQISFQKNFFDINKLSEEDKVKYIKETILCVHKELSEVLDTLNWKTHRKEDKILSKSNTLEEIIDCFKYLLNLCVILNVDAKEFETEFFKKSNVVKQRYNQEILSSIKQTDKICAIDLDDTLSNSSEFFTELYNEWNEKKFKNKKEIKKTIPLLEYENFKDLYRESGVKVNIPIKEGAKELCDYLKNSGYKIIIISARPYHKYYRIFSDTLEWLEKNKICFDALYFEKEKHIKILKQFPQMSFIIEDNFFNAKQISDLGYKVYLLSDKKLDSDLVKNVMKLEEIILSEQKK
jgi:uncharacterized HAD superfamily protein